VGVTPETIQLVRGGKEQLHIPRAEVHRVYAVLQRSRSRRAAPWIGMAAGGAVGVGVGWAIGDPPGCKLFCKVPRTASVPILGLVGAGIGALVGHFIGGRSERLAYSVRP
jgi:hypothetical protein